MEQCGSRPIPSVVANRSVKSKGSLQASGLARLAGRIGIGRAIAAALIIASTFLRVLDPAPLEELRLQSFDFYQLIKPRQSTARPVVIVDVDEESMQALGQWPWPRTLIADLVNRLTELGAVVVGFDVIFPEPDRYSPGSIVDIVRDLDGPTRERIRALPNNDQVLAEALRKGRVVLGESGVRRLTGETLPPPPPQVGIAAIGGDPAPYLVTFPNVLRNLPILENAAVGRGLFTIRSERDGVVRRVPLAMKAEGVIIPALSLEMLRVAAGSGPLVVRSDQAGIVAMGVPGLELPTDRNGQLWVNFGLHDAGRYVSAHDVLAGRIPRERIDHKLVLIGTSAIGLLDRQTTAIDPSMPGVEIHAQILENALTRSWISYPAYAIAVELTIAAAISLATIVLVPVLGALTVAVLGAVIAASLIALSWLFYIWFGVLLDFTYPLLSTLSVYLALVFTNYLREQAQRQQIRSAFGQYLSPALVEQLVQAPEKLVLGGEEREMTIMFSDVRGFTTLSEFYRHDPQGLTSLMNRLLTPLTGAIVDHKGTIDKYMGDAIMAFWNAPLTDEDHAVNACTAALDMCERLKTVNHQREQEARANGQDFVPIRIGIGVNTGTCVVGNMGSDLRFDYSVLGDPVNLTSRIEGQTKTYGVSIIAGAKTMEAVGERFAVLELDFVRLKGKIDPEHIYGVFGGAELAAKEPFIRLRDLSAQMLGCVRHRDWTKALDALELCRAYAGQYGLSAFFDLYAERIKQFQANPPPDDWDGVFVAEE
jgi:adenylate cyclase